MESKLIVVLFACSLSLQAADKNTVKYSGTNTVRALPAMEKAFDKNGDGVLDQSEQIKLRKSRQVALDEAFKKRVKRGRDLQAGILKKYDKNRNGVLDEKEMISRGIDERDKAKAKRKNTK